MKYRKSIVLFTLFATNLIDQPAPEVTIEQGTLSGKISVDGTFFEYVGIPYATTNKDARFKAPLPPPSWEGVFKAVDEIYRCPHYTKVGVIGTEDCLKINVYVPAMVRKPIPVMVFVHGGAFIVGSGGKLMYGPEFLLKQDIILVTFNYRLGALGFICLGIKEAPGNAGLKDQVAALRWVKNNIAAFGGDPDNITLFGQSAGGASASILFASEATEGLFNRAIIQSGSSLANWAINRDPVWSASLLAKELGYDTKDPYELYQIFSNISYIDLISVTTTKPLDLFYDTQLIHLPCVEKTFPDVEAVLPDVPYNLIIRNPKNIPVIYGTTSKEGLFLIPAETERSLEARNGKYLFASDLNFESEEEGSVLAQKVQEFYFDKERISMKNLNKIKDLYTHLYFEMPAILESEILLNRVNASIYNYYFNYNGGRNFLKTFLGFSNETGACHGDDLLYLFKGRLWPFRINYEDLKIIDSMTKMWANFAKYGDPTPPFVTDLPAKWIPSTKNNFSFLHIDRDMKMAPMPNPKAFRLWKDIYSKYRLTDFNTRY